MLSFDPQGQRILAFFVLPGGERACTVRERSPTPAADEQHAGSPPPAQFRCLCCRYAKKMVGMERRYDKNITLYVPNLPVRTVVYGNLYRIVRCTPPPPAPPTAVILIDTMVPGCTP